MTDRSRRVSIKKPVYEMIVVLALIIWSWGLFVYCWHTAHVEVVTGNNTAPVPIIIPPPVQSRIHKMVPVVLPAIQPKVTIDRAGIVAQSPKVFAFAHGTVVADGKLFIGMANRPENPFSTNMLTVFDESGILYPTMITLPLGGDIETMVFDQANDMVYFMLSSNHLLTIYSIDPHTYRIMTVVSTSTIDTGRKPAITTDGRYIYGITDTDPSIVFRVGVHGAGLTRSTVAHIPNGHSAAIGIYGSTTEELYFGGGMSNGFEKVDPTTLAPIAKVQIDPCGMSDDMPFVRSATSSGYVYIGCEGVSYGVRVRTSDLSFDRFSLPGASLGLFVYNNDLYNAAQDGTIDIFPNADLTDLHRYKLEKGASILGSGGQEPQVNEILYSPVKNKLFITAWWGIQGLYQISTSTPLR